MEHEENPTVYNAYMSRRAIIFCFHFLLLVTPLFFSWFTDELFEFNKMILTYAVTIVISSLWIARMVSEKKVFIRRTPFDVPILLFLASQITSTLFSMDIHTSLFGYYTRFNGGLLSFFCYIILFYAFISNVEKRDVSKLFLTTFVSGVLVSLMAIPEHFGHSLSCLMINMYRYRNQAFPSGWLGQFYDDSCWIQDVQTRVFASFGQPNWLAAYAILLIPVGIILSFSQQLAIRLRGSLAINRIFYGVSTTLLFLSLIYTKSRSGVLGLVAGLGILGIGFLVTWILHTQQKNNSSPAQPKWWHQAWVTSIGFAVIFSIAILTFGTPFSKSYGENWLGKQLGHSLSTPVAVAPPAGEAPVVNRLDIGGTDSADIRRIVWTGAIRVWQRYPLFGSGVETFAYSYYKDRPIEHNLVSEWDFLYNKAHNEFLNFLATTGLVGLVTYLTMLIALIVYPIWFVWKKMADQDSTTFTEALLLSFALAGGLVALSISNFFGFSTVMVNILLFLLPGFFIIQYFPAHFKTWSFLETEAEIEDRKASSHSAADFGEDDASSLLAPVSYVIIFCIGAALLFAVYSLWRADFLYNRGKQYIQANQANNGLQDLQSAIQISPNEPTFYDDLASAYSRVAVALAQQGDATTSAQFAQEAIVTSNKMLALSPSNLNLYKTQARVYMSLAQLEPSLLLNAKATLQKSIERAPTDPKLRYFLSLVEIAMGDTSNGIADLEKTIQMKSNYEIARLSLGEQYEKLGKKDQAKAEYQYILQHIQPDNTAAQQRLASLSAQLKK